MSDQKTLAVRPWHGEDKRKQDLPYLLSRLIQHGGGTLSFTEESLEEEIRRSENGLEDDQSDADNLEDGKSKAERMQAIRTEIVKSANEAFQESALALDLISLLLTKYNSTAESSVSPALKNSLPLSTLAAENVQMPMINEAQRQTDQLVVTGWKLQALSSAADSILQSATRLEEEMSKEAKYWNQVLAVKERGWAISRMPREQHTLAVRFGFLEASSEFRDRSMGALRKDDDGGIMLDLGPDFSASRTLRARVVQRGSTIAVCTEHDDHMDEDSVESAILQARNNIFDAELFSELLRESRSLITQGVRGSSSRITVPIADDTTLLLELTDSSAAYTTPRIKNQYEKLPRLVLVILRILLSHSHTMHYKQRTARPPVIGEKQRARAAPALLRPVLSLVSHKNSQDEIYERLNNLSRTLKNAGILSGVRPFRSRLDLEKLIKSKGLKGSSDFVYSVLTNLTGTLETIIPFYLSIPETIGSDRENSPKQFEFSILIRTHTVGTEYKLLLAQDSGNERLRSLYQETSFPDAKQIIDLALSSVKAYIVNAVAKNSDGKLKTIAREGSELYIETDHGAVQTIRLDVSVESLKVSYTESVSATSPELILLKVWKKDSTEVDDGGLIVAIEQAEAKIKDAVPW